MNGSPYDFDSRRMGDPSGIEPIAIVGAACRLPGAPDLDALARLLIDGVDAVSEIPDARWNKAQLYHPERGQRGKAYTFAAGVIDDVSGFDPAFFGISPREAIQMDPQQRLCLELAYEAIEDAGIDAGRLAGEAVGVFVGGSSWDYLNLHVADPASTDAYSMTGVTLCSLSNRVSYAFDLRGPSFTVDTACSSSLVALHQACEAIRGGQVPAALVGGVSLLLAPQSFVGFCQASMLSPNGRCHAFDARADGYVRAEGGGFVVLKPLGDALAAGDPIRAIIRGTGVNSDGRTTGFSLPNRDAQAALLEQVYTRFRLDPNDLAYVEAHGTGTPAGDPIEAGALGAVLGRKRRAPLPIGSIKTNIGHLEAASGMAGLLKAMLVAEGGVIPPSLHCRTPNPHIPFGELNLALVPQAIALPEDTARGRLIGINSFGFGGTNAHAVLETPIQPIAGASDDRDAALPPLLLSAQSDAALRALAGAWRATVAEEPAATLPSLLRGAALNRRQHKHRAAIGARDPATLREALEALAAGQAHPLIARDGAVGGKVAFIFSGNGSQWAGMAADATALSPEFRTALAVVDDALSPWLGWSVAAALAAPDADALRDTATAQPLLFAIQVALVMTLREHGVEAQGCMGHSVGEVAAAWAAGALSLDQAARVIAARSQAQQARHGIGGMAVLGIDAEAVAIALAEAPLAGSGIEIAAHNSGQATTVAGPAESLALLDEEAKKQGWRFVRLDLDYAFHSAAMDPIAAGLRADLEGLAPQRGHGFYSTVMGEALAGDALDADYWWRNVRDPVLFGDAATAMVAAGFRIFVEIGPHPVVRAYLSEALRDADVEGRVVPSLSRRQLASDPVALIALRCHAAGADVRDAAIFRGAAAVRGLPHYPWQREPFWLERTAEASDPFVLPFAHPLLGYVVGDDAREWRQHIGLALQPWLADHVVGGAAVVPAAALIDMALAAARARSPQAAAIELFDAEIGRALVLEPGIVRETRLRLGSPAGDFEVASRARLSDEPWTVHMRGRIGEADSAVAATAIVPAGVATGRIDRDALYARAADMGLEYGPAFRAVQGVDLFANDHGVVALAGTGRYHDGFLIAPDLVDGALQGLLALAAGQLGAGGGVMPWRFGRVRLLRPDGAAPATARMRLTRIGPRSVRADIALLDRDGAVVAELIDCWFVRVALDGAARIEDMTFHTALVAAAGPSEGARGNRTPGDVLAGIGDADASDAELLGDAFIAAAAAEALRTNPTGGALADQLAAWLDEDGLSPTDVAAEQPAAAAILQSLMLDQPRAIAEVAILAEAAAALPRRLADGSAADGVAPALWDQLLHDSPSAVAAADALGDSVARIAADYSTGRPLRLLQIGARRGRFTARLLRRLAGLPITLIAAADAGDLPLLAAQLDRLPGVGAVAADAIFGGPFDVVVGLHAGTDAAMLARLPAIVAPGALILLADPAPSRLWTLIGAELAIDPGRLTGLGFGDVASRTIRRGVWPVRIVAARADGAPSGSSIGAWSLNAPAGPLADAISAAGLDQGGTIVRVDNDPAIAGGRMVVMLSAAAERLPAQLADLARLAGAIAPDESAEIVLVLRAAAAADPIAAALNGARRVLANEAANVRCRLIRVDPALSHAAAAAGIVRELANTDGEDEVALTPAGRCVARVRRGLPAPTAAPGALRLAIGRPGLLDTLGWEEAGAAAPGPSEIAIKVEAAGLNFRDVMWAMGLLPDEALLDGFAGATLGLECAGMVAAVGAEVTRFAPGDRVMAFAPASLGTHAITQAHAVMRMPEGIDFAAAATVPVAFLTVAYAVGHLARLQAGETILIHGGAGGVGLAAIQYARARGARIFATAGSPAKRALLTQLGVEAVFDSRSLAFADDVLRATGGAGVDVVLNSLAGEAMRRSLGLLKPFGRFLELGKRDFYENSAIGLRPFRHNVTYFGIDADQLPLKQPKLAQALFDEIAALFAAGRLHPLPHRLFDFAEVEDAFRLMQGSGHIGKIVLAPGESLPAAKPVAAPFVAAEDKAYLVTGGLGGFGLETARWLARHGARRLALVSRRGAAAAEAAEVLAGFARDGVDARAYACDVGDEAALAATLRDIRADLGAIGGVVHAAVAMDDALLPQLDADRFARALRPKLEGAAALDRLTRGDPVSLFLLFSSVTTPMGNPGQGNYVAANAAIEAIAERRHADGLPALAVQWGPIGDAGYLSREKDVSDLLSRQLGSGHMTAAQALDTLPALLAAGLPVAGVATVRWGALKSRLPLLGSPLFAEIRATGGEDAAEVDLRALLASCTPEEAREKTTALLIEEIARIMKLAPDRVEPQRPLAELGMDSLMAVELRLAVEQRFGVSVPLLALSEGATLSAMAGRILRGLGGDAAPEAVDEAAALTDRIRRFEGAGVEGPADGVTEPAQPSFAAAASNAP